MAGESVLLRTIGFNLPCRQFLIGAQVTRDRRLPMVDEFVLRTLRVAERMSVRRLRGFFGFSELEIQTVLADLREKTLVVLDGDVVRLHPSAVEMFRTSPSGAPQIVEVESWVNRIWFDLVTKSMIGSPNLRHARSLIELKGHAGREDVSEAFARQAFQENFREYLQIIRKITDPAHLSLYAITSVDPGRFSFAQLTGEQVLNLEAEPSIETKFEYLVGANPQKVRLVTDAVTDALKGHSDPEPSLAAREEYARILGIGWKSSSDFVDPGEWLATEISGQTDQSRPILGSTYVDASRKAISLLLEKSENCKKIKDSDVVELVWFRPGGTLWGTSEDLRVSVSELRASVRKAASGSPTVLATLVVPAVLHGALGDQRRRFQGTFERAVVAPPGLFSPALEVLLIRGVVAAVMVLIPISKSVSIWLGRVTTRNEDLDRIERQIGWTMNRRKWTPIWIASNRSSEATDLSESSA